MCIRDSDTPCQGPFVGPYQAYTHNTLSGIGLRTYLRGETKWRAMKLNNEHEGWPRGAGKQMVGAAILAAASLQEPGRAF
eukprot:14384796-Alexandrium_andersonii.AAC.1